MQSTIAKFTRHVSQAIRQNWLANNLRIHTTKNNRSEARMAFESADFKLTVTPAVSHNGFVEPLAPEMLVTKLKNK